MFFIGDITYPHIDQNGISGKLTKNELTSPNNNFFGNGRTKLVYDSFWPQGPPELRKKCLGWFSQLTRPPRTDLRFFAIFSRISSWAADPRKTEFLDFRVRKKCSKIDFFKMFWIFQKIWNLSSILICLHLAYSQYIKNACPRNA